MALVQDDNSISSALLELQRHYYIGLLFTKRFSALRVAYGTYSILCMSLIHILQCMELLYTMRSASTIYYILRKMLVHCMRHERFSHFGPAPVLVHYASPVVDYDFNNSNV